MRGEASCAGIVRVAQHLFVFLGSADLRLFFPLNSHALILSVYLVLLTCMDEREESHRWLYIGLKDPSDCSLLLPS